MFVLWVNFDIKILAKLHICFLMLDHVTIIVVMYSRILNIVSEEWLFLMRVVVIQIDTSTETHASISVAYIYI